MDSNLRQYGARIKSIYLELKNYTFYHNPSDINSPDKRFIGRKEIKKRLKNLLTNSSTHSGTYLVTGFRGMGKTSFVNQVLNEIIGTFYMKKFAKNLFIYIILIWISSFFNKNFVLVTSIIGTFLLLNVIISGDEYYKKNNFTETFDFIEYLKSLFYKYYNIVAFPFISENKANKKLEIAKMFIRILSILMLSNIIFSVFIFMTKNNDPDKYTYENKIYIYYLIFFVYFFTVTLIHTIRFSRHLKGEKTRKKNRYFDIYVFLFYSILSTLLLNQLLDWGLVPILIFLVFSFVLFFFRHEIKSVVHSGLNNNEIIPIRINLGKEKLTEEDILRLIAYALVDKYKDIKSNFSYFKRFVWTFLTGSLVYLIALAFYYNRTNEDLIIQWKNDIHLNEYFPSQELSMYKKFNNELLHKAIKTLDSLKNENISFLSGYNSFFYKYNTAFDNISYNKIDNIHKLTYTLDYVLITTYYNFSRPINDLFKYFKSESANQKNQFLSNTLNINNETFHIFPFYDFFFIVYLLLFSIIARYIIRLPFWGTNHSRIYKRLANLTDRIDAKVYEENNNEVNLSHSFFNFGLFKFFKKKEYPIADAREIEMNLISILNDINNIQTIRMRPRFIFILDELDKVQPNEKVASEIDGSKEYSETEWVKRRQDTIRNILTNLKHFFNTAKAKFIFIAGREMYDAALADVSDRDALIGSMFHDIIYIHSFYKDPADERLSDITSMTERYVCQFLISEGYMIEQIKKGEKFEPNINWYNKYLKEKFPDINIKERIKITITLQDFISYISYRSNGAPKKITKIFEEYITNYPENKYGSYSTIITKGDKRNLYLHFNYKDQYIFTIGKYLFNPFVIAVNKYISHFEDKLLVSTSFLLNHLYKFHKVGFSYNTLELTPEIIAIYKAPELRDFIKRLIVFMNRTHLRKIISGLYDFKFESKLEKEIAFVSKISEKESAALNFTLDESLVIKSIFRSQLKKLKKYWKAKKELNYNIESLTFLYANLGDLNFNDNQFFEAIHYYNEALLSFKNAKIKSIEPDEYISYLRIYLKLGLAYEMVKNMSKALMIYETIISDSQKYVKICEKRKKWNNDLPVKKNSPILVIQRLFYQALLAKLQVIEKSTVKTITKNQLNTNINHFKQIIDKYLEPEQQFLLKTEYFNKIGDLLFYKNGILFGKNRDEKFSLHEHIKDEHNLLEKLIQIQKDKSNKQHLYALPISAYKYYMIALANLINIGIDEKFKSKIMYFDIRNPEESEKLMIHFFTDFLFRGAQKDFPITRLSFYSASANAISDAGDTILILASAQLNNKLNNEKLENQINLGGILNTDKLNKLFNFNMNGVYSFNGENSNHLKNIVDHKIDKKDKIKTIIDEIIEKIEKESIKKTIEITDIIKNNDRIDINLIEDLRNKFEEYSEKEIRKLTQKINKCKKYFEEHKYCKNATNNKSSYKMFNKYELAENKIKDLKEISKLFNELNREISKERIKKIKEKTNEIYGEFDRIHIALRYFIISAGYFLKSDDYKEYVHQLTKILYVFRILIIKSKGNIEDKKGLLEIIRRKFVNKAIRYNFKAYDNYNKSEEQKIISSIDLEDWEEGYKKIFRTSTSASEDIKEIILIYKDIELLLDDKELKISDSFITPCISTSLEFNRLHELNYKNHFNYHLLKQMYKKVEPDQDFGNILSKQQACEIIKSIRDKNGDEEISFVILDSLFSLFKMERSIQIFGLSYIHNHSWFASIYRRIGFWIQLYYCFIEQNTNPFYEKQLQKLIGKAELNDLNPYTYYEKALRHSYSIYSTHFEGKEYYDIISDMNYLDDDFNDGLYHFSASIERVVINLGIIEKHIDEIKGLIKDRMEEHEIIDYDIESYV